MLDLLDMLDNSGTGELLALVFTLCFVGRWMIGNDQVVRRFGLRLAGLTFFVYGYYRWLSAGSFEPFVIQQVLIRSLLASGIALGFSWMVGKGIFFCIANMPVKLGSLWPKVLRTSQLPSQNSAPESYDDPVEETEEQTVNQVESESQLDVDETPKQVRQRRKQEKLIAKRNEIQFELDLAYNQLEKDGRRVFDKDEFNKLKSYVLIADSEPALFQRAEKLKESMQTAASDNTEFGSIDEIAQHYQQQRERILSGDHYDEAEKQQLIHHLNRRESIEMTRLTKKR